jgi:glucose-6-phosphate 1-dehydrogenase
MKASPTTLVIFGASGDLAARKLVPALYSSFCKHRLPENFRIIGTARSSFSSDQFREKMRAALQRFAPSEFDQSAWRDFARTLEYQPGDIDSLDDYQKLGTLIASPGKPTNALFYLAVAPQFYSMAAGKLGAAGLTKESSEVGYRRIVIEKPFGVDLASARALNRVVHDSFEESQVYRIDHYLGKETVQNVMVFRFANAIFEPLWNRNYIDHVQISVTESVGVGHRASYYDKAGVLRDMFQNHLMQLLTLVAMEPPAVYGADALRNEKVKVLAALRKMSPQSVAKMSVRAQYEGYTSEPGVHAGSETATFAALKLFVDNWRWQGVPFYLRSGKMMPEKASEIIIQFRRPPMQLFDTQTGLTELFTNRLSMCIQPDEGMHLCFMTKVPDQGMKTHEVDMEYHFRDSYGAGSIPGAYERLLLDALQGDASLFARSDEIEYAWTFIDAILSSWDGDTAPPLVTYAPHTWGPDAAEELISRDGRWWVHDCKPHGGNTSKE